MPSLLIIVLWAFSQEPADTARQDRELVDKLRSLQPQDRDSAYQEIKKLGSRIIPLLERVAKDGDTEGSLRASRLIRVIRLEDGMSPRLRSRHPALAEKVCDGGTREWSTAFLELAGRCEVFRDEQRIRDFISARQDMSELAMRALAEAEDRTKAVLKEITRWKLREAIPAVEKSLEDARPEIRAAAVYSLNSLGAKDKGPALIAVLKDDAPEPRRAACVALGELRLKEAAPRLAELVRHKDDETRQKALEALGRIQSSDQMPAVLGMIEDENRLVRGAACRSLGRLGAKEAAPKLVRLLDDKEAHVQESAFGALGMLRAVDQVPSLVPFLKSEDPRLRIYAIDSLAAILATSAIPKILPMLQDVVWGVRWAAINAIVRQVPLEDRPSSEVIHALIVALTKDEHPWVRRAAAEALSGWQIKESIPGILGLLRVENARSRSDAAEALARLDATDHLAEIVPLLKDEEPGVRRVAAACLCDLGSKEGASPLMNIEEMSGRVDTLHHLNALLNRKLWSRLKEFRPGLPPRESRAEVIARVAKHLELKLDFPERPDDHGDDWAVVGSMLPLAHAQGMPLKGITYLDWLEDAITILGYTYILEEGTIRVVTAKEGLAFWKRWQGK